MIAAQPLVYPSLPVDYLMEAALSAVPALAPPWIDGDPTAASDPVAGTQWAFDLAAQIFTDALRNTLLGSAAAAAMPRPGTPSRSEPITFGGERTPSNDQRWDRQFIGYARDLWETLQSPQQAGFSDEVSGILKKMAHYNACGQGERSGHRTPEYFEPGLVTAMFAALNLELPQQLRPLLGAVESNIPAHARRSGAQAPAMPALHLTEETRPEPDDRGELETTLGQLPDEELMKRADGSKIAIRFYVGQAPGCEEKAFGLVNAYFDAVKNNRPERDRLRAEIESCIQEGMLKKPPPRSLAEWLADLLRSIKDGADPHQLLSDWWSEVGRALAAAHAGHDVEGFARFARTQVRTVEFWFKNAPKNLGNP